MCFTTYGQAATVTLSQPANGGLPTQILNIAANCTSRVDYVIGAYLQDADIVSTSSENVVLGQSTII